MAFLSPATITTMEQARRHRAWALGVLVVVYVFNFLDRQVLSILQEDIRRDLNLQDFQLGMLTGLSFAFVYCTFGIPVARIADATSRKGVIAISLAVWSGFTALCVDSGRASARAMMCFVAAILPRSNSVSARGVPVRSILLRASSRIFWPRATTASQVDE